LKLKVQKNWPAAAGFLGREAGAIRQLTKIGFGARAVWICDYTRCISKTFSPETFDIAFLN
jgi:hypothetical protein